MLKILCRYKKCQWRKYKFYVVDVDGPHEYSNDKCYQIERQLLRLLAAHRSKVTVTSIEDLKPQFPDQFDRIGSFEGKASLFLKRVARPSIDAPCNCSIHLKARLQQELDTMENDGIIRKIEYHTDWCSSITTRVKKDGSLRVCFDPKRLNDNLNRCPHKIPTLEEHNPEFAEARVFSEMDANAGYWSRHLDEATQDLILARAQGYVGIADDVVVYGRDNAEHENNLLRLMQVAKEERLVFNSKKCAIKTSKIVFFVSAWHGWNQARPEQNRRHTQDAYHTRQGRSATVHQCD